MNNRNKNMFIKLAGIYIVLSVAGLCSYNFRLLWGSIKKRGFDCLDDSLRKPYLEDTVSSSQLYIIGVYVPIVIIILCEFINNYIGRKDGSKSPTRFKKFICKVTITLTSFLFGLAFERLLKNIAKFKMGRLRPHFLAVCSPIDTDGYNCNKLHFSTLMLDYECSPTIYSKDIVNGVFVSFPSGHSSLIFYGMVFLACYLQRFYQDHRLIKTSLMIFLPIIQISCVFLAGCVAVSRVLDYKHHWSDVLGGQALGSSVALAISLYMHNQKGNIKEDFAFNSVQDLSSKPLTAVKVSLEDVSTIELANE